MTTKFFYILVLFALMVSCKSESTNSISQEVIELSNLADREEYLLNLFNQDQAIRIGVDTIVQNYGYDSEAYREYVNNILKLDSLNFLKLKTFLELHGYPSCSMEDKFICTIPVFIVGHYGVFEKQKEIFDYFYMAYTTNLLEGEYFLFMLNEMYEAHHGKQYAFESNMPTSERVQILMDSLDLKGSL